MTHEVKPGRVTEVLVEAVSLVPEKTAWHASAEMSCDSEWSYGEAKRA